MNVIWKNCVDDFRGDESSFERGIIRLNTLKGVFKAINVIGYLSIVEYACVSNILKNLKY